MASDDITETLNDISGNACFEWDVYLGQVFKQLNKSFETLCHNGQKFREKSGNVQRGKESNHIDKYRRQYEDEVKTLASSIEQLSQIYARLPKPCKDHGGYYRGELTSKTSSSLCGLGRRKTGKQPSAQDITDNLMVENQELKKQLTDLETNRQVLEQRIAELQQGFEKVQAEKISDNKRCSDLEIRLEAELQEKNDVSVRYAELEKRLEAELQEINDLSARYAKLEKRLEAELQEKKDLSVRNADLERSLEAELQEKNDLSVRNSDLERHLEAELQERNDLSLRNADLERSLEAELQEKNDLSVRNSDLERHLEAELQERNDLSLRYANLEWCLKDELQEKNDLSVRYAYLESRLEAELQEKNDLSVRLSAIIASRIKDGNTTIVDLSDENRPTKLAEYFSELYDNEWTDCFDELDNQAIEESESIRILLKILTDIFNACLQWSTEDYFLLVQRAIDRTYIGQAENVTDERPNITGSNTHPTGNEETPQKTDNTIESGDNAQDAVPSVSEGGPCNTRQESKADSESNEETPQTIDHTNSTIEPGENAQVKIPSISEDGSSDKRGEPRTYSESNEQTLQTTELTEPTVEPRQNSQAEVPSIPYNGSSEDRREPKTDSESNEGTPQKNDHTQAKTESAENGHGDAQSVKEDEDVLETTDPAITAEESREMDQSDTPFHDNTNNGSLSEDQDGSRKAVTQGLRCEQDKDRTFSSDESSPDEFYTPKSEVDASTGIYESQDETHTDDRSSITEETESVQDSENKCDVEAPSATGDGPSKKEHESNAEASEYVDGQESTEAGQNGQGEEPSSTEGNEKLPPREKEEVELPNDLLQPIKEIKKRRALKVLPTIHEFVRRKIPALVQARFASTYFQTYIQKCTEFSWLAVVQDPPLVLLADGGTKFDRKLFKEYMRRGQFVEFVVWPALLVEEEGAILSKGVAQGINKPQ